MKVIFEDTFQKISFRIHNLPFRSCHFAWAEVFTAEWICFAYMPYCHVVVTSLGIRNKNHRWIISNIALYWLVTSLGKKFIDEFTIVKACHHKLASSLQLLHWKSSSLNVHVHALGNVVDVDEHIHRWTKMVTTCTTPTAAPICIRFTGEHLFCHVHLAWGKKIIAEPHSGLTSYRFAWD